MTDISHPVCARIEIVPNASRRSVLDRRTHGIDPSTRSVEYGSISQLSRLERTGVNGWLLWVVFDLLHWRSEKGINDVHPKGFLRLRVPRRCCRGRQGFQVTTHLC